jgi:hypothetical protein
MSRTAIKCNCGHRIGQREVMQTGYYPRMFGPSLVFVRFRCSRCKKLGEQFVKQEDWESGILKDTVAEANVTDKERFATLGPIEMQELANFHDALESLSDLNALTGEFRTPEISDGDGTTPA